MELIGFAHTWGEHRRFFRKPPHHHVYSLPASWTGAEEAEAFVAKSGPALRWGICHVPMRFVHTARQRIVRIIDGWPTTDALLAAYRRISLLT